MIRKLTEFDDQSNACTLCVHFTSYREIYETDYEPDDCGRCSVNKDKDGTSYASVEHMCANFELNAGDVARPAAGEQSP